MPTGGNASQCEGRGSWERPVQWMRSTQSAYSQLGAPGNQWGSTSVIDNPVIQSIALKQSASPAQVILIENYMFKLMAAQRTTKRDVSFYAKKKKNWYIPMHMACECCSCCTVSFVWNVLLSIRIVTVASWIRLKRVDWKFGLFHCMRFYVHILLSDYSCRFRNMIQCENFDVVSCFSASFNEQKHSLSSKLSKRVTRASSSFI